MHSMIMPRMGMYVAVAALLFVGCQSMPQPEVAVVSVEFRPAFDEPAVGRVPMTDSFSNGTIYVSEEVIISNKDFAFAKVGRRDGMGPHVEFALTDAASARFGEATERMVGEKMAVLVDGKVISAPTVSARIIGHGEIAGRFTEEEAERIAAGLNAGAR